MNRLTCEETFRRLDDYLDRELTGPELIAVEAHLRECAMCASEFGTEREVIETIRVKLKRIRVPDGLLARISARLEELGPS